MERGRGGVGGGGYRGNRGGAFNPINPAQPMGFGGYDSKGGVSFVRRGISFLSQEMMSHSLINLVPKPICISPPNNCKDV